MSQLIANVLVFPLVGFGEGGAAGSGAGVLVVVGGVGVTEQGLVGMVVLPGGDDDLRGVAGAEELEGLALRLSLDQVPPGGAQAAEGLHDSTAVLAGAHGDLREGVAIPPVHQGAGLPVPAASTRPTCGCGAWRVAKQVVIEIELAALPGGRVEDGCGVGRRGAPESSGRGVEQAGVDGLTLELGELRQGMRRRRRLLLRLRLRRLRLRQGSRGLLGHRWWR